MKKIFFVAFFFLFFFGEEKKFKVNLDFKNVLINKKNKSKNLIHLSIFTNEKKYLKNSKARKVLKNNAFYSSSFLVTNSQQQLTISLPKGNYVITCFNDKNNNKKFDLFFGIPKEQYGFANFNDKIILTQPRFKDLLLKITSQTNYTIKMY